MVEARGAAPIFKTDHIDTLQAGGRIGRAGRQKAEKVAIVNTQRSTSGEQWCVIVDDDDTVLNIGDYFPGSEDVQFLRGNEIEQARRDACGDEMDHGNQDGVVEVGKAVHYGQHENYNRVECTAADGTCQQCA